MSERLADEELSEIAWAVDRTADDYLRGDVFGAAWERFLRYNPRTRAGAWLMAKSARNDLYRREQTQNKIKAINMSEGYEVDTDAELDNALAVDARAELLDLMNEVAPDDLEMIRAQAAGRRLDPELVEAARWRLLISVKARTNGDALRLKMRALPDG